MKHFAVECPNCGSNIQSDDSHKSAICSYCETQVYATADHIFDNTTNVNGKEISAILDKIRTTIKANKHHTTVFKDMLLKASQKKVIKKEIQDYIDSKVWSAEILDTELVSYTGDSKKFIVPHFIKKIKSEAFSKAFKLESIYISESLEYMEDNIFMQKFLDITIYTNSLNSTAAKYAAINNIPFEVISSKNKIKIFGGRFGELYKLITEIANIRLKQVRIISNHYQEMWKQRKDVTDNSKFIKDCGGLMSIKNTETYDLMRFNLKFLDFINKSFDLHGHIDNFLFWNKDPNALQNDIIILRKVLEDLKEERLICDFFYETYRFYNKKPPVIDDYELRKSQYKFIRFIDMLK